MINYRTRIRGDHGAERVTFPSFHSKFPGGNSKFLETWVCDKATAERNLNWGHSTLPYSVDGRTPPRWSDPSFISFPGYLYHKYKLFRRFLAISLLAQSSWRRISGTTGGVRIPSGAQLFLNSSKFLRFWLRLLGGGGGGDRDSII